MNIEKLKWLKEVVQKHRNNFNMNYFVYLDNVCGTVACIAGWAVYEAVPAEQYQRIRDDRSFRTRAWIEAFAHILECTYEQAQEIAVPQSLAISATFGSSGVADHLDRWTADHALRWIDFWITQYETIKQAR